MRSLDRMSDKDVIRWLNKTAISLTSYAHKGGYPNAGRGQDLRDRFDDLKDEATKRKIWIQWCNSRSYSPQCDGIDFFA